MGNVVDRFTLHFESVCSMSAIIGLFFFGVAVVIVTLHLYYLAKCAQRLTEIVVLLKKEGP